MYIFTTFPQLGIKFTPPIAKDILDAKDGAALKLVYQLKMYYDQKKQLKASMSSSQKLGSVLAPAVKPLFDKVNQQRLEQTLRTSANQNVKERDMAFHLQKFQSTFEANMYDATKPLPDLKRQQQLDDRQRELQKLSELAARKEDELKRASIEWQANQTIARERVAAKERFLASQRASEEEKESQKRAQEANAVTNGIDAFESNLERLGVGAQLGDGDEEVAALDVSDQQDASEFLSSLASKLPSQADLEKQARKQQVNMLEKVSADKVRTQLFCCYSAVLY